MHNIGVLGDLYNMKIFILHKNNYIDLYRLLGHPRFLAASKAFLQRSLTTCNPIYFV